MTIGRGTWIPAFAGMTENIYISRLTCRLDFLIIVCKHNKNIRLKSRKP